MEATELTKDELDEWLVFYNGLRADDPAAMWGIINSEDEEGDDELRS